MSAPAEFPSWVSKKSIILEFLFIGHWTNKTQAQSFQTRGFCPTAMWHFMYLAYYITPLNKGGFSVADIAFAG